MKKIIIYSLFLACVVTSAKSQIVIDGVVSDWNQVPIISEPGVFPFAKVLNSGGYLNFAVRMDNANTFGAGAWNTADLYLDADNNSATGMKSGWLYINSGVDYLVQGSDLYNYTGTPGADNWSWGPFGIADVTTSGDLRWVEERITSSMISSPAYTVAFPYYYSTNANGQPDGYLPANDYNFSQRKGYTVKARTEVSLSTSAYFTSANAYYYPFMKDENIAQYLDFQSGAYPSDNPKQWASWALNLTTPGIYDFKMTSSSTGSGKVQLVLYNMETNALTKTFTEVWYPVNATMTENTYSSIDLSDVPAGKYMLKLTNPTAWDTFLKVEKVTLSKTPTKVTTIDRNIISVKSANNTLSISCAEAMNITIFTTSGQLAAKQNQTRNAQFNLAKNSYIVNVQVNGKSYSEKIIIK